MRRSIFGLAGCSRFCRPSLFRAAVLAIAFWAAVLPAATDPEEESSLRLLSVRRVYVDRLTGGETAAQIRDMIIASLQNSRLFVITENQERADAVLRGSAEDLVFTDFRSSSEGISVRASAGAGRTDTRNSTHAGAALADHESSRVQERRHEAVASVRLVDRDGDVIWSTTQESLGGKFRGSSADVADKVTRKLVEEVERVRKARTKKTP